MTLRVQLARKQAWETTFFWASLHQVPSTQSSSPRVFLHVLIPFFLFSQAISISSVNRHVLVCSEPYKMVYIRQRNLAKLHEYKYAGVDKSLVSKYILKPFYTNFVIKCFPMSMA